MDAQTVLFVVVALYMLPTMIVAARGHRNTAAIVLLNLLAGWTIIGWVVALVMAVWVERPAPGQASRSE